MTVAELIDALQDLPAEAADVDVCFALGSLVAEEDETGLTAPREDIAEVELTTWWVHGETGIGYVRLVGRR